MDLVVGAKPTRSEGEWGVAMGNLERLIMKLCNDTHCTFVLIAHIEREKDEISGSMQTMVSTLGRKLAPKIPQMFSDVIRVKREGTEFNWSTTEANEFLAARNVNLHDKLPPSFVPLINHWKEQGGVINSDPPPSYTTVEEDNAMETKT